MLKGVIPPSSPRNARLRQRSPIRIRSACDKSGDLWQRYDATRDGLRLSSLTGRTRSRKTRASYRLGPKHNFSIPRSAYDIKGSSTMRRGHWRKRVQHRPRRRPRLYPGSRLLAGAATRAGSSSLTRPPPQYRRIPRTREVQTLSARPGPTGLETAVTPTRSSATLRCAVTATFSIPRRQGESRRRE